METRLRFGREFERQFLGRLMAVERAPIDSLPKKEKRRFLLEMAVAAMTLTRDGFRACLHEKGIPERAIKKFVDFQYDLRATLVKPPTESQRTPTESQRKLQELLKELGIEDEDEDAG